MKHFIPNWHWTLLISASLPFSCSQPFENQEKSIQVKVLKAKGYVVPKDSMATPKIVGVDESKLTTVRVGKPAVVPVQSNSYPVGKPKVVKAGKPRICTPGKDTFLLPKTVPAIERPFLAGLPTVVKAKDAYSKDQNPYGFTSFNKLQGLTFNNVNCFLEDKMGNLWIGTQGGGISKYDGHSFTHFTQKEGLSNDDVTCVVEDKNGNLWIGTWGGGVTKYNGKTFTHFSSKEGLSSDKVLSITEDKRGNLWIGTWDGGATKYDGKTFTHFTSKQGLSNHSIWGIMEDKHGNLWFGTDGGVSKYDGHSFAHFTQKEGLSSDKISRMLEDKHGNLWFGTFGGGVTKYDGKRFTHFTEREGLSNNYVQKILEDKNGNLWFGTYAGLSRYDGQKISNFYEKEGLSSNYISTLLEDKHGNLWIGTWGGGISTFSRQNFIHFTKKEGLNNDRIWSITEDKSKHLWFGTWGGGVTSYDGQNFTHFTEKEGLKNNVVPSILEDKKGNQWFSTWVAGVSKYDGHVFKELDFMQGIRCMLEDKNGNLWFGQDGNGVLKYDGHSYVHYTTKEGLSNNLVWSSLEDKQGNLWFGTGGGGVTKYDGKRFTHFTEKEGLSNNYVQGILEDKLGNLWFGTRGGGATKYDGQNFTHITEQEGLSNNDVRSIFEDKNGNLWFGTRFGVSVLTQAKLIEMTKKIESGMVSENDVFFTNYTYEDGFLGIGVNPGKTIYEAQNGDIWFGADDRLSVFHPVQNVASSGYPNIQLTNITLFNENIPWIQLADKQDTSFTLRNGVSIEGFEFDSTAKWTNIPEHLSLKHTNNNLTFYYVGITLKSPGKVMYQYQLEGYEKDWNALSSRTEATYNNLPSGTYSFRVKARSSVGIWSPEKRYTFTIRPPWWKTGWAYGVYLLLLAFAGWRFHLYQKERTIKKEREKAQARELEQAKAIEKAYSELGMVHENLKATQSQLIQSEKLASLGELTAGIAHEIQNPLNFVNNFAEVSAEMIDELKEELEKGDLEEVKAIAEDLQVNLGKINHHGGRASSIVKGMLEHSRASTGIKEPTDLNALADEYLRLAYHGLRAKDSSFNCKMETHFDPDLSKVSVIPQDIGRVLLNLINNAFYAVAERSRSTVGAPLAGALRDRGTREGCPYEPTVTVSTQKTDNQIIIKVMDNGNGIPEAIREKIFQPFFTTKPAGQGTGLGLSLAYDIVTKGHGGILEVNSTEGLGTEFVIRLV